MPSNPPNASNPPAGLQGNNSYSYYMPLPSVFPGVQDCRLPGLKPPKRFQPSRRPPRQQLLQLLHAPAICFSGGSRLPFARPHTPQTLPQASKAPAICFSGGSSLPFGRPQTPQTLPQASKATTLTATCPQTPQTLPTLPQASKATTLTATTCPCHLFFRGFKTAVCPASNPRNASNPPAGLQGNNSCGTWLSGRKQRHTPPNASNPPAGLQGNNSYSYSYYFKTAVCSASNPPNASNPPAGLQGNNSYSYYMPLPSVFQGVQDCRLPALKSKATTLTATATTSRLPFARPQTPQTLPTRPQASKATTLTATTCPCHLSFRGFKTAVCPPSNPRNPPAGLQGTCHLFFRGFKTAVCPPSNPPNPPNPPRRPPRQQLLQLHALKPPKRFQPSSRPPRQQLLQLLHAPAICFSGGSRLPFARPQTPPTTARLPFARPQTPQTLPTRSQASKATTLTATTCPCHLSYRGFKTAVCPPSNPRQQLLQLQLLLQDCRLLGLKPPKRFQPARRPPRQQLLQLLHAPAICLSGGSRLPFARPQTPQTLPQASKAPAICFSGGSRLPFARPQTPQTPQTLPQASKATALTATCPQTPQTLPTLPQASKATTLTATTCPCHLFFRGFKTAVCPPSNPPNPPAGLQGNHSYSYMPSNPPNASNPPAGLQGNNSYSYYMPLPSVFPGVQACRLPGLKPPKRFQPSRRPPRQQLLQLLHAPAICFSGGSRLPFARPQTPQTLPQASKAPAICFSGGSSLPFGRPQTPQTLPQASKATTLTATCPQTPQTLPTLPQASKATTLTATTCPCHLFFRGFKTAVCSASNPPNASNPPAGLQGNNSYSYYMPLPSVLQGVQDCRLPALKSKATTLTATATTSRLPSARPQTPQTLPTRPQASKATTLTATTCPCHLSFRGFKTAVCPPSNPPNPPAGLQGTCHLFFRGFKTAVCPPSNPPNPPNPPAGLQGNNSYSYMPSNPPNASNPPAGLQGNNSYSDYMPLPSVFQGVQDCRLPALKPPKPSRRPPRQPLLQLHALKPPKRFQPSRRPPRQQLLQLLHAPAICFSGGSSLPFARPQTPQTLPTLPQASKATTLTATTCPCHLFFRGFKTAVCPPSNPPSPPAGLQGTCHLFFRGFKPAVWPPSNPPNPPAGLQGNNSYSYMPSNPPNASNPPAGLQGNNSYSYYMPLPSVFQGVQDCRLPGLKPPKRFKPSRRPPRQQLLQLLHAPAICFSGGSRLPFARPQTPQTLPQASKAPAICFSGGSSLPLGRPQTPQTLPQASKARTLTATCPQTPQTLPTLPQASKATTLTATTCPCHLSFRGFKTAVSPPSNPPNFPAGLQGTCHLFFRGFKTAVCPPSNPPNPPAGLQGNNSYSYMPSNPPKASNPPAGLQGNNSYSYYMPLPSAFQGVQDCRLPALKPPKPSRRPSRQQLLQLHALKPPKRFQPSRRPPRQQLLQLLHAPAICFSGGSRLPFARPQTPQTLPTLPQASKATTLTATTCLCHLFFRGFKPAVCPPSNPPAGLQGNNSYSHMPSNPPNASNPPAGLQGNNSYSYYMPLPSVFQGVQDCRLPGLKPPKRFQPSRRPPRQQPLQLLHAPAICFSGGARLPPTPAFATAGAAPGTTGGVELGSRVASKGTRPQTLPTLPQASKATTLTATATTSRLPFARPQTPQTLPTRPQASKATTLTATTCPCHLSFRGFKTAVCPPSNPRQQLLQLQLLLQDCRLLGLKPPKRFQPARRPPRQQLLQLLHAPAICLSGGSRLPFARPQTPQTLPQASKAPAMCFSGGSSLPFGRPQTPQTLPQASKATTLTATCPQTPQTLPTLPQASKATTLTATTCPCHLFFRGFKTAVCPASNPPNASNPPAGLQGNNSYSYYMPLPSVFQGVQDCRLPALKPPKPSRRPPRHLPSVFQGVQACRLAALKPPKPSRRPPRQELLQLHALKPPKRFQPSRRPPRQQLLQLLHAPAICLSGGSRLPLARPQTPQTFPQASKAPAICFSGGSRLPFARPQTPQTLPQASKATTLTATCPQTPQKLPTLPQASKPTTLTATTCLCHLLFRGFKTAVCPPSNPPNPPAGLQGNNSYSYMPSNPPNASNPPAGLQGNNSYSYYMPLPSVFPGVQDCRLPGLKPPKRFQPSRRPPRQQLLQLLHAPAICFSGGSSLPFARPQTLPQASKATTLTATCPQTPQTLPTLPQASKATTLTATTCPCHLFFRGFKTAVCPASNPLNASNPPAGLQGNNPYSYYMPLPSVFQGVQDCRRPRPLPRQGRRLGPPEVWNLALGSQAKAHAPKRFQPSRRPPRQQLLQLQLLLQDCRLLGLKPPKRFQPARRPPRQQLLQLLHAPAICLSGGSRLPFARPQTPQTLPQASKAPAICFSGGSRLRRPPRQQLLQLHAPAICFSGGAWATRACDSPSLLGLLFWHEPFCFLAWFPSRRVMVDVNLPKRTA